MAVLPRHRGQARRGHRLARRPLARASVGNPYRASRWSGRQRGTQGRLRSPPFSELGSRSNRVPTHDSNARKHRCDRPNPRTPPLSANQVVHEVVVE
eukprot:scaffold58745_cov66-Phaeocystis_antarctica.AAC.4